jgi:SagB-type dehydrogenase family enzyme
VERLAQGTYYFDPQEQNLVLLKAGVEIGAGIHVPYNQPYFATSAFSVFLVAETDALQPLYGDLSTHLASVEAGLMTQLLDMTGPACGVGFCQIGTISFEGIREFLELKESHILVHSLVGGRIPETVRAPAAGLLTGDREQGAV